MHCSDEDLIAHLDGENGAFKEFRVRRHLTACWDCRRRMAELETEIHSLARSLNDWSYPDPHTHVRVRARLADGIRAAEVTERMNRTRPYVKGLMRPAWVGLVATLAVIGWIGVERSRESPPSTAIARALSAENKAFNSAPVQQDFTIEFAQIRPVRAMTTGHLRVWAERGTGRFASRWMDSRGTLKHALWKPGVSEEYVYAPTVSRAAVAIQPHSPQTTGLASLAMGAADTSEMESALIRWLESRSWSAVSLAAELSLWSKQDGTVLKVEKPAGRPVLQITATRFERRLTAVLTVEVERETYQPRLETIRFESPDRVIEYRIAATASRRIASDELAASFRPGAPLTVALDTAKSAGTVGERPPQIRNIPEPRAGDTHSARMAEARYVLHRAGACLGEPVEIMSDGGQVRVTGRNRSSRQTLDIVNPAIELEDVLGALAEFRNRASVQAEVPRLVRSNGSLLPLYQHAAALRQLSDVFPQDEIERLPPAALHFVETMVQEHVEALRMEVRRVAADPRPERRGDYPIRRWRESAATIYDKLATLEEMLGDYRTGEGNALASEIDLEAASIVIGVRSEFSGAPRRMTARR